MTDYRQTHLTACQSVEKAFTAPVNDTTTTVSLSTSSAAATGLTDGSVYRLWSDVNCFVVFTNGGSTAADTDDMPLTAELPEFFRLTGATRIAGIVSAGTGTLYITKMA